MLQSKYLKIWGITVIATLLISCSTTTSQVKRIFIEPKIPLAEPVRQLNLQKNIRWDVVTHENIDEFLDEIKNGNLFVFYAMSVTDYEKLALNMDELKRYIKQQQDVIDYYEEAIK